MNRGISEIFTHKAKSRRISCGFSLFLGIKKLTDSIRNLSTEMEGVDTLDAPFYVVVIR